MNITYSVRAMWSDAFYMEMFSFWLQMIQMQYVTHQTTNR